MINLESIKKSRGFTYVFNEEPTIDAEYVKRLRQKLKMSQSMFAILMHVQKKTVEKWEQGKNPVTNGNAVAMILFDRHPELVSDFIEVEIPNNMVFQYVVDLDEYVSVRENRKRFTSYNRTNNNVFTIWKAKAIK